MSATRSTKASPATPEEATGTPIRYEDALGELERLVQTMEAGQLPLDELLDGYRRGAELLAQCRERLQAVEAQVQVLEGGQLVAAEAAVGLVERGAGEGAR